MTWVKMLIFSAILVKDLVMKLDVSLGEPTKPPSILDPRRLNSVILEPNRGKESSSSCVRDLVPTSAVLELRTSPNLGQIEWSASRRSCRVLRLWEGAALSSR